tara:strand:- start:605 stop:1750 length:1146 start_codon:yes stop_codon:yes gene_type:complete
MKKQKQWIVIIALLLPYLAVAQYVTDSCAVFEVPTPAVKMMGYTPDPVSWKTVNYVVHVHYTELIPYTDLPESVVYDADDHLNEEFEEAFFDFNLLAVEYHNFDDYEYTEELLLTSCVPYSSFGWTSMNEYVEDIIWDRELFMNVHVFPAFCTGILGFAWTAYAENVNMDGVWVRTNVFGRDADHLWGDRDENKTLIHEVGHYLSLHHVFRNVEFCGEDLGPCQESGDYVCDTPPTKVNWSCEIPVCPPGAYNYTPNNHMDYYTDSCRTNFTQGQIDRMHAMIPITRPGIVNNDADVCVGDISGDYVVGMNDLLLMLVNFGDAYWEDGDINGDGFFTVTDFQILLANWGTVCFGAELDPFYREEQLRFPKQERGRSPFPFR